MIAAPPSFRPERLTEAREARGLRSAELAEALSVSPSAVTGWETGGHAPETGSVVALSAALGVPTGFFGRRRDMELESIFVRSADKEPALTVAQARRRLEWTADVRDALTLWVDFPGVCLPPAVERREFTDGLAVEEMAESVRRLWGLGLGPIHDLIVEMENGGVTVSKMDMPGRRISGASAWRSGRPVVLVASSLDGVRTRMSAAAQLGHIVLHRNAADIDPEATDAQAELFARSLLLPAETFARDVYRLTPKALSELKPKWKVSIACMVERLIDLGILEEDDRSRFQKSAAMKGWHRSEPGDEGMYVERHSLLSSAVRLLLDEGIADRRDIVGAVGLDREDIADICGLPTGSLRVADNVVQLRPLQAL